jgi:glucokinase
MKKESCAIGVDLGGTKIEVALVDGAGNILKKLRLATQVAGGLIAIEAEIANAARELLQGADRKPLGIGIGVAGQIDPTNAIVRFAPNLNWHDAPLKADLQQQLNLPVALLNDVRAATWAEWLFGAGRECEDLICLFVGTGVGGSVVSGGRMLDGPSNSAGELGHMTVDLHGPACHCNNQGCLEAIAGGWAIARRAREAVAADPLAGATMRRMADNQAAALSAELVARAAHAGDPLAARIVDEVTAALIAGVVSLVNGFNPGRLILGGGVIEGLPELIERIALGVRSRALQVAVEKLQVLPAHFHNDAGVIGAAAFAMQFSDRRENGL